ncbi:carboxypeptidase regulatory-like domain-containing protein [Chloroflexota bacterium]
MNATGAFSANLSSLSANTTYHFRAKAAGDGPGYGADDTFITTAPPSLPVGTYYVATTGSDSDNGSESNPWRTIAHATDVVPAGSTIIVKAGDYDGFTVNATQDISIISTENATVNTALHYSWDDGSEDWTMALVQSSANITIDGINFDGASINQTTVTGIGFGDSTGNITNLTVNNVTGTYMAMGICIWGSGNATTAVDISGVTTENSTCGIWITNAETSLDSSTITGMNPDGGLGLVLHDNATVTMTDSEIRYCRRETLEPGTSGIGMLVGMPDTWEAMEGWGTGRPCNLDMTGCTISNNNLGIFVDDESSLTANYNNIAGNDIYGVYKSTVRSTIVPANATNNWWGDATGPTHSYNSGGSGDNVTGGVRYRPWLDAAYPGGEPVTLGSIEGYVYKESDNSTIDEALIVVWDATAAYIYGNTSTNASGYYRFTGLSSGNYTVRVIADGYATEWYQDACYRDAATLVPVTVDNVTSDIDFYLVPGGTISGYVYESDNTTPISWGRVLVFGANGEIYGFGYLEEDGSYTTTGLLSDNYTLQAQADGYAAEWYGDVHEADNATSVEVIVPDDTPNINFSLDALGTISGYVYETDNTTAISGARVRAYEHGSLSGSWVFRGEGLTDSSGHYVTAGLPDGDYAVRAEATDHASEWYDNTYFKDDASSVSVTLSTDHSGINFALDPGGVILGYVYESADNVTPIADLHVNASDNATNKWVNGTGTDSSGYYAISGLPVGSYLVGTNAKSSGLNYIDEWYDGVYKQDEATPVLQTNTTFDAPTPYTNFYLEPGGSISGTVLDQDTGEPLDDASSGSINLTAGWHKFVYRQQEREGGQASRAAFKAPGDADWRWFSTSELEMRISPDSGAASGILLINKKSTWDDHPENHSEMVACVDSDSANESGWYGSSVVDIVNHDENIHGNDDYYTSYYEGYFYVETAGLWYFSTDSDDASEIVIDEQVVAYWYSGHGMANRWEHKLDITVHYYDTRENVTSTRGNADGSYTFKNLASGSYIVQARAPGYVKEWYAGASSSDEATPVSVTAPDDTPNINFTLQQGGSISGTAYRESDNATIANLHIQVFDAITDEHFASTDTDSSGNYTLSGLPAGSYKVRTRASENDLSYLDEWYNNKNSQDEATPVSVTPPDDTPNINFSLEVGGTISGTVYRDSDNATIANLRVEAYDETTDTWFGTDTDSSGNYTLSGLYEGSYQIRAKVGDSGLPYATEWYDDTYNRDEATLVPVTVGQNTPGIDFSLGPGGTISGHVYQSDNTTSIEGARIDVVDYDSLSGRSVWHDGTRTSANGSYTAAGLPTGVYGVRVRTDDYAIEWYDDTHYQSEATPVSVTALDDTPNINFILETGGTISGTVYRDSGNATIANLHVYAVDNATYDWMSGINTDSSGNYTLQGFPAGSYLVGIHAANTGLNYVDEWYDDAYSRNDATPVSVIVPDDTPGIDFILEALVTRDTVEAAIADGITWLAAQQNPAGPWGNYWEVTKTALAVLKLETHATSANLSPFDPAYQYSGNVTAGLDFLFANAHITDITTQTAGDPDTNGNGWGIYFRSPTYPPDKTHNYDIYETSIAVMAIAASANSTREVNVPGSPVDGWTYATVAQDVVDYLAWSQTDWGYGRGGWNYEPMNNQGNRSDQSNSGWASLGLSYAENFGSSIPGFVRDELDYWIDYIQDDIDGGSYYSGISDEMGTSILRTGNLLQQMAFVGNTENTTRVQSAIAYLVNNWDENHDPGWRGDPTCYHATYTTMKGLEAFDIETIDSINWYQDFTDALLSEQTADGWWQVSCFDDGERILSTEWALLTLQKTTAPTIEKPDLVISEKHEEWVDKEAGTYQVYFTIKNRGNAIAPGGGCYNVVLIVDGTPKPSPFVEVELAPGDTWSSFYNTVITLNGDYDEITVYADGGDNVTELNEDNNSRTNTWPAKDWTFMVYMAADNDLDGVSKQDINEMEMAGSTDNVSIVVLRDGGSNGDSRIYYIEHDEDMGNINSTVVKYLGEVNTGDNQTLVDFVEWTIANYAADRYALVLWDSTAYSSAAWRGMGVDNHSDGDYLTIPEIRVALGAILDETGVEPDFIGFDTSLMALAEVDYEIVSTPETIIVASQEFEQREGWAYQPSLTALTDNSTMTATELASQIITDYVNYWNEEGWDRSTLSAVNSGNVTNLGTTIDDFAQAMISSEETGIMDTIRTARDESEKFFSNSPRAYYIDLYDFADKVEAAVSDSTVKASAIEVMNAVNLAVVAEGHGSFHEPGAHGISIYYPACLERYYSDYATTLAFTANTTWDEFLDWILLPDTTPPSIPTLVEPSDNTTASAAPVLKWNRATDNASIVRYSLQVSDNISFASPVVDETDFRVRENPLFYRVTPPLDKGIYYWRVQAVDTANNTGGWSEVWSFEVSMAPKWSYTFQPATNRMRFGPSVAIADLGVNTKDTEPDSDLEIAAGSDGRDFYSPELDTSVQGAWRVLDSQGDVEWVKDTKSHQPNTSPAIADLDGDGNLEIIGGTNCGMVEVMDKDGNFVWTFPSPPKHDSSRRWLSSPAVADVNDNVDGLEVIISSQNINTIFCFDGDNSDEVDDGISASDINWGAVGDGTGSWEGTEGTDWDVLWIFTTNGRIISTPAVADVDNDGQLEVVFGAGYGGAADGKIYCLNGANGTLEWSYQTGANDIDSSAGLADFDNDGDLEVVVGASDGKVYFINNNGDAVIGASEVTGFQTGSAVRSSPSIGDFDGDGDLEVIIGSNNGKIYSLAYDPATNTVTEQWHYTTGGSVYSSAALANRITGDLNMHTFLLVARPGFNSIEELVSSNANIWLDFGHDLSHPYYQAAIAALDSYGGSYTNVSMSSSEVYEALQTGAIDAAIISREHPYSRIEEWTGISGTNILPWSSQAIAAVTTQFPRAVATELPANTYEGQTEAIAGYALRHWLDVYIGSEDGRLYILDGASGSRMTSFRAGASIRSSPSVADIDGDGVLEVVFADWSPIPEKSPYRVEQRTDYEASGDILWSFRDFRSDVSHYATEWPMFRNGAERTGQYVPGVQVSINAPDIVSEDVDFTVTVDINQVEDFDAANYDVSFDATVLRLDSVTNGNIAGTVIPVSILNEISPGTFRIVQNVLGVPGVTGRGHLAVLHFHVVGSIGDSSNITLSNGALSSNLAEVIPATWIGDLVEVAVIIPGDANGDGVVNAIDITKVERIIAGLDSPTLGADANQDGNINAIDITKVERIIAGLD